MELTSEQRNKALWWTGTLTEASVILGMPWRRAWAYVSGSPITIRPILKSAEAKKVKARLPKGARGLIRKGGYCFLELLKLKLADILLSAGLSGKTVQGLLDGGITESVGSLRD